MVLKKIAAVVTAFTLIIAGLSLQACTESKSDDSAITKNVKAKLASDPTVSKADISVDSSDGVVTISGNVENSAEEQTVVNLTKSVEGVRTVESKLTVKTASGTAQTTAAPAANSQTSQPTQPAQPAQQTQQPAPQQ